MHGVSEKVFKCPSLDPGFVLQFIQEISELWILFAFRHNLQVGEKFIFCLLRASCPVACIKCHSRVPADCNGGSGRILDKWITSAGACRTNHLKRVSKFRG
jgi:hypothetical protein